MEDWAEIRRLRRSERLPFGDRAGVGNFAEHGEGGVGFGWSAERAPAASVVDDVEPRIRELLAAYPRMPATVIAERIGWS